MISLFDKSRPVLVLSPHPDDAELGAGGTIGRLTDNGFRVIVILLSKVSADLLGEASRSWDSLGALGEMANILDWVPVRQFPKFRQDILDELIRLRDIYDPGCVFTPALADVHQDHRAVTEEAYRAFRHRTILGYYEPWNTPKMEPSVYVALSDEMVQRKLDALRFYESQKHRPYFEEVSVHAVLRMWGLQCGTTWAESFDVIRGVVV